MIGGAPEIGSSSDAFACTAEFIGNLTRAPTEQPVLIEAFRGAAVAGRAAAAAFFKAFCLVQSAGQGPGRFDVAEQARIRHQMHVSGWYRYDGAFEWPALLRLCDMYAPAYKT